MDFWRTVLVLFRRWYLTVPAFFATLGLAGAAYSAFPAQYQSGTVLVLTVPLTGGTAARDAEHPNAISNPLMNFDHSLSLSGAIVIQQMNSSETAAELGLTPGGKTTYTVSNGSSNPELLESGPFLFITGTASTPDEAKRVTEEVAAKAIAVLDERQTALDAPASTHITVEEVVAPTDGQLLTGSPLRAAAAALALGAVATLTVVYGFESFMTRRRRRRAEKEHSLDRPDQPSREPGRGDDGARSISVLARRAMGPDASTPAQPVDAAPFESPDQRVYERAADGR
jgi:hypothetical protein